MTDGYAQTYDSSEASEVAIDIVVKVGVAIVGFATLIGLVMVWNYFKKGKFW